MDLDTILKRIKAGWYDEDTSVVLESRIEVSRHFKKEYNVIELILQYYLIVNTVSCRD